MAMSKAIPASFGRFRIVLALRTYGHRPPRFGLIRRPRPSNCTRRGRPLVSSGDGEATIRVIATSRIAAGQLSVAVNRGQGCGGLFGALISSQVYWKMGTGFPP